MPSGVFSFGVLPVLVGSPASQIPAFTGAFEIANGKETVECMHCGRTHQVKLREVDYMTAKKRDLYYCPRKNAWIER